MPYKWHKTLQQAFPDIFNFLLEKATGCRTFEALKNRVIKVSLPHSGAHLKIEMEIWQLTK